MSEVVDLNEIANQTRFARLVGASQPSISKHLEKGRLTRDGTYQDWFLAYSQHLRDEAAGRGGSLSDELAAARIDESRIKSANGRVDYLAKIEQLIPRDFCAKILKDWASFANREFADAISSLVSDVQAEYDIDINDELVKKIAVPTTERIKDHAGKLAESFNGSSAGV